MNPFTVTGRNAHRRGTLYRLSSKATVWYSSAVPPSITHASNGRVGSDRAAARSRSKRTATVSVFDPLVRSRAVTQHRRRWSLSAARSGTTGTGVAHIRSRSFTRFSTRGFSRGVRGRQNLGANRK